jgi:hypothetical protein
MEAPICRTCGQRHWSRLCYEPRNEPVTPRVTVTADVTLVRDLEREIVALHKEVAMLKRQLASANAEPKVVMSAAERMKKMRAKKANASGDK